MEHAWAIQDLTLWPERTQLFWKESSRGISYVLLSGHPSVQRHPLVVLSDAGGDLESLLGHLPNGPFVVRETPANVRPLLEARLPAAVFYEEQRMIVDRATLRARPSEGVRRVAVGDLPALLHFMGVPARAGESMKGWIQGAVILARFEGEAIASMVTSMIRNPAVWHLAAIETKPEHRRKGYAAAVTSAITMQGLEVAGAVTLTVLKSNVPALRLYESLGYRHQCDEIWVDNGTGSRP